MASKPEINGIKGVSLTALLIACLRAKETELLNPIIKDEFARELAGKEVFNIFDKMVEAGKKIISITKIQVI